jgi:hypothetical protein
VRAAGPMPEVSREFVPDDVIERARDRGVSLLVGLEHVVSTLSLTLPLSLPPSRCLSLCREREKESESEREREREREREGESKGASLSPPNCRAARAAASISAVER